MQQDKKLGLALGVLLIGTVAAFFFRNESDALTNVPRLTDATPIDERVADAPHQPYGMDPAVNAVGEPSGTAVSSVRPGNPVGTGFRDDSLPAGTDPMFQRDRVPEPADLGHGPTPPVVRERGERTLYRVQPGDTLSGIARRFLGRSSRYAEVYEANTNMMRHPDDLKVGMMLTIPPSGGLTEPLADSSAEPIAVTTRKVPSHGAAFDGGKADFLPAPEVPLQPWQTRTADPNAVYRRNEPDHLDRPTPDALPIREPAPSVRREMAPERSIVPTGPGPIANRTPIVTETDEFYTVRPGDNLERIAIQTYGDRTAARKIYEHNRDRISRPDQLAAGTKLRLPH